EVPSAQEMQHEHYICGLCIGKLTIARCLGVSPKIHSHEFGLPIRPMLVTKQRIIGDPLNVQGVLPHLKAVLRRNLMEICPWLLLWTVDHCPTFLPTRLIPRLTGRDLLGLRREPEHPGSAVQ